MRKVVYWVAAGLFGLIAIGMVTTEPRAYSGMAVFLALAGGCVYYALQSPEAQARGEAERREFAKLRQKQREEAAEIKSRRFRGLSIDGNTLHYTEFGLGRDREFPLAGAKAGVESAGIARSRLTATRVLGGAALFGKTGAVVGGLARKDQSTVFLVVELADGEAIVEEVPVQEEGSARKFAAKLTTVGRAGMAPIEPASRAATAAKPEAGADSIEQLRKLAELRDAGILTEEEFAAKKADILGRL